MPTASYFGRNAFVGLAKEAHDSSYGTAKASGDITVRRPVVSCSVLRQVEKVPRSNLMVSGVHGLRKGHYIASDKVSGSLELEMTYDNCGYFVYELMGAAATTPESGLPKTHAYTMADVPCPPLGESTASGTTMFLQRGTGQVEAFEGVCFTAGTFSCAAGEQMSLSMDLIGETSCSGIATAITYSEPTAENLVLHNQSSTLSWNSQTFEMIDFEFKIENAIADRMRLGSTVTKQPVVSDFRSATMTISIETDDVEGYAKFLDDTSSDAIVEFSNGAAGADLRKVKFSLNKAYIESYTDEISEVGLITASITFRAEGDGSSGLALGASIEITNGADTAVHNG